MKLQYNTNLKIRSRNLRKTMTDAERKIWRVIRMKQIQNLQFYRQRPIGNYIVDFYCPAKKIIIEIDGNQHYNEQLNYDKQRDEFLNKLGFKVLRFNNIDALKNTEGVIDKIIKEL